MFGKGDEMFGKWETKCSAFRRTKVWRKSPAAYQETQIKKKILNLPQKNKAVPEGTSVVNLALELNSFEFFPKKISFCIICDRKIKWILIGSKKKLEKGTEN